MESHHRSIIDHLELGTGGHHLQEDLSKGVLRTIHNVENGTLHFITIPPAANSREQEYIESSLLGADLLSSHLPNGLLVDYISAPGPPTPSNQFHPQTTNLLDHHGSIQTYTAEDLQTLVDASSLQTSENDRKLFLQFVNKPSTQLSHEAPVIVTNPKDISSVNTLNEHDKLTQSAHTQLTNVNHMPVATSGSSYLHYHHQDQLLSTTHNSVNPMAGTGNVLATHHNAHHHHHHHHHHPHHHGQSTSHQIIQNTAQQQQHQQQQQQHQHQQQQQQQQQHQQQQNQSHLSSIHSMLQGDCSPSKLFHVASSAASTNIAISTATSQNCIQMPPLTPIKRVESPKRYLTYQMVQTQAPMDRSATDVASADNFLSRDDLMDCDPRTDDEEDAEAANALSSSNHFTNTYLPHKKRLAKTLVDSKNSNQGEQYHRDSVIANDHQERESQQGQSVGVSVKAKSRNFACQLCSDSFEDQLMFFTHLKGHYEPPVGSPTDDGKSSDPKKKPKLPRVKHTKKLKNDKSSRTASEGASTGTSAQESQPIFDTQVLSQGNQATSRIYHQQNQVGTDVIVSPRQQTLASAGTELDNAGEFSETEDMLEGIRNVVQKVQEAVDTDTNDGLGASASGRSVISAAEKAWFQAQQHHLHNHQSEMAKSIDFGAELDTQEIHISAGTDNFVLFLNKSDFHEQEMLNHPDQQTQPSTQQQPVDRLNTNAQHHPMLTDQLHASHNPPAAFILDAEQQLQPPTMNECDMNIQILGLGSTVMQNNDIDKLVDFTLTAPQLSELDGAKLLKDELKSNEGSEADVDREQDEYYLSDDEDEDAEGEEVETIADGEEHVHDPSQHHGFSRNEDKHNGDDVTISTGPPGKKKGRKKVGSELQPETGEQDAKKKAGKKYPCAEPECDKVFNSKTAVRYHELQHKNERPYKCVQCPKKFFTSSALKVHERLHSGEKPYKCEECGRAFRQWGDMKYHQSSIHSNEKTHQCEFCGKKFARRYSLVLHRKIHLNEKNHVCDICNKAFRASSYLQSHRMIHTGEKPYSCNICMKKFRCGGDMKRHLKTHDRNKTSASGKSSAHDEDSFEKTGTKATATGRSSTTDVIDLTKIKCESSNKVSAIQAPPVVTVLAKDISHAGTGTKITTSAGQLVYLTQGAGDQFRKPDETVLMDVTRW